jgi:hypothetical protein
VETFEATLKIHVVQKRPFQVHCKECENQFTELKTWKFLGQPTALARGRHQFPFSVLLGGHLPATMDTPLMSISYEFKAEAVTTAGVGSVERIKLEKTLDVRRSLPEPETQHHSVRVFPPTNIKAAAEYDQVVHPTSKHTMTLRLDGLTTTNHSNNTIEYWKLKKVAWKLEETIKTIAPACGKHDPLPTPANSEEPPHKKGVQRVETRVLGDRPLFEGWKSDYSGEGRVEMEIDYGIIAAHRHLMHAPRYAFDSKSLDGTEVSHTLMIEMVVSKEWAPIGKSHLITQTGTGRILRMHYNLTVSEFPGLGVSWDNEAPPLYQDVPPSPPTYPDGEPISYEGLEMLEAGTSGPEDA